MGLLNILNTWLTEVKIVSDSLISKQTIILELEADDKIDALHNICAHLFLHKKTLDPANLHQDIIKREELVSTFAGQQVAIPHVITEYISKTTLCFARTKNKDFTWNGHDQDVRLIFLLCVPTKDDLRQLRQSQSYVFSSIAQLMGDPKVIDLWLNTNDEDCVLNSLQKAFESNLHSQS